MNFRNPLLAKGQGFILLIARVILGLLFLYHGVPKFMDTEATAGQFEQMGFPGFMGIVAAVVEVGSGILLILGLFHSLALVLLGILILVAIVAVQLPQGIVASLERDVLILAVILVLLAFGPGHTAMDNSKVDTRRAQDPK